MHRVCELAVAPGVNISIRTRCVDLLSTVALSLDRNGSLDRYGDNILGVLGQVSLIVQ